MEQDSTGSKQVYRLGDFEGPLDLLLFLIKKSEINIYDIPIAHITEQYIAFLEYSTKIDLDNITEFYIMAATLLYIKSRMLLPEEFDMEDEFDDPRKELVDKLIEYQKYKEISKLMLEKERETEWYIERKRKQITLPFPDDESLWEQIDVWDLVRTFSSIISTISSEQIIDLYEEVTVKEKLSLIYEYIETKREFYFTDLLKKNRSTIEIVCAFLALLEAVKMKSVAILQNKMFGDIRITTYA